MLALTLSSIVLGLATPQGLASDMVLEKPAVH